MQNKIQKMIVFIALICITQLSVASKKNDVVKISLPNKAAIEIIGLNINKYKVDTAFISENIERFFKFCKTSNLEEMMELGPKSISIKFADSKMRYYSKDQIKNAFYELNVTEREYPNQIVSSNDFGKNLYYLQKHEFEFENNEFTFKIKFDDKEQLRGFSNKDLVEAIDSLMNDNYNEKSKFIQNRHYIVDEDYEYEKVYENGHSASDQISFTGSMGLESVKNTWAANLEVAMMLVFNRKGRLKNSFNIHYEWQYDFSNPDKRNINQFASLGYRRDFSKDLENRREYTFKLGYLVYRQGDLYNDNTFKLAISRSLGKNIYMEPQLYFNDFFQNAIPSIKVGIGF